MKFKRAIVLFLFIFPIFILIGLVAYRKQHPANISYGEPIFSASRNQVSKTLNDWNLINSDEYLDVTDRQTIKAKLDELFQRHNLSEQQINEGETSSLDLLESLKTGNYDQFIKVRVPSQEVEVSDAVLKGLQHYSGLAASGSPFDYYQKIWKD